MMVEIELIDHDHASYASNGNSILRPAYAYCSQVFRAVHARWVYHVMLSLMAIVLAAQLFPAEIQKQCHSSVGAYRTLATHTEVDSLRSPLRRTFRFGPIEMLKIDQRTIQSIITIQSHKILSWFTHIFCHHFSSFAGQWN